MTQFQKGGLKIRVRFGAKRKRLVLGQWPTDLYYCSGSVLSHRWVLTSAHCLQEVTKRKGLVKIRFGINKYSQEGLVRDAKMVKCHERFYTNNWPYDLCLLLTFDEIPFSERVQPVALPLANETVQSLTKVRAAGWGMILTSHSIARTFFLWGSDLDIVEYYDCNRQLNGKLLKYPRIGFCAGNAGERRTLCSGDSGSSAVIRRNNKTWVIMGVTSRTTCLGAVFFVDVPYHANWIRSTIARYL